VEKVGRKADVTIRLSEFEMPPVQDILLIGRSAPIGPEAARRMMDAVAPDQYVVFPIEDGPIEAVVVRRRLLDLLSKERLIPMLLEEVKRFAPEGLVVKGQITLDIIINRQVSLS
jgi:hypothetical protein